VVFPMYAVSDGLSVWLVFLHAVAGLLHDCVLLSPPEDERPVRYPCEFTHTQMHTCAADDIIEEILIGCQ